MEGPPLLFLAKQTQRARRDPWSPPSHFQKTPKGKQSPHFMWELTADGKVLLIVNVYCFGLRKGCPPFWPQTRDPGAAQQHASGCTCLRSHTHTYTQLYPVSCTLALGSTPGPAWGKSWSSGPRGLLPSPSPQGLTR